MLGRIIAVRSGGPAIVTAPGGVQMWKLRWVEVKRRRNQNLKVSPAKPCAWMKALPRT